MHELEPQPLPKHTKMRMLRSPMVSRLLFIDSSELTDFATRDVDNHHAQDGARNLGNAVTWTQFAATVLNN